MRSRYLIGTFLFLASMLAHGQTLYVSDELVITLRTGPSTQNAIIRNLSSGDSVVAMEELSEDGYSRVRAPDGTEGWVLSRFLQEDQTGDQMLVSAQRNLAAAQDRLVELEAQVEELSGSLSQTRAALDTAQTTGEGLSDELADIRSASANAVELRDQNESLRRRVTELNSQVDVVTMQNSQLTSRNRQNWFIVGAAVLLAGIVVGLVAPSLRPKRKSSW